MGASVWRRWLTGGFRAWGAGLLGLTVALAVPAAAGAAATVTEFTGGVTPGFTSNAAPYAITAGPDGNIWFTEQVDPGGVARVNANGTVTELRGGVTPGFSANSRPFGITTGPDGNIWFTEQYGGGPTRPGALGRVNPNGTVTEFTAGPTTPGFTAARYPAGITTGPDGKIWFTEQQGGLGKVNLGATTTVTEYTTGVTPNRYPTWITPGSDGNIWFTEQQSPGGLGRVTPTGTVTEFTGGVKSGLSANGFPNGITTGADGNLWFTEGAGLGRLGKLNPKGNANGAVTELTGSVTPGFTGVAGPAGITTGADGNIWFTEQSLPGAVARVNPNGTVTEFMGGTTPGFTAKSGPFGITTGRDGRIWFTEYGVGKIGRLTITPEPGAPARDTFAPRFVRALAAVPNRFRVGRTATAVSSRRAAPVGTKLRFSLSEPAAVTITFLQARPGRRVRRVCRAQSRSNRRRARCTRYVSVGSLRRRGLAGVNAVAFSGRIGRRALALGSYRVSAVARDAAGNVSKTSTSSFVIVSR